MSLQMKKRDIKPTTRTWATLLTYFPKSLEQNAEKVLSRYTLIYDEAQTKIQNKLKANSDSETEPEDGLQVLADSDTQREVTGSRSVGVMNNEPDAFEDPQIVSTQYIQILTHFGKFDEVLRVLKSMPASGPHAPDAATFAVVLKALLDRAKRFKTTRTSQSLAAELGPRIVMDESGQSCARVIWERLVQGHRGAMQAKGRYRTPLDSQNAVQAIRALTEGTEEDKTLAFELLPELYGLSRPGESAVARADQKDQTNLPTLQLDDRAAETILNLCLGTKKNLDAAHFAKQFLDRPDVLARFRQRQWQLMMAAFANAHDSHTCQRLMEAFGPKNKQPRWSYQTYAYLLKSARWTKDMDRFLDLMEEYVDLPEAYVTTNVRGREPGQHRSFMEERELRKARPARDIPQRVYPTLEVATLMLETAIDGQRLSGMRQALRVSELLKEGALMQAQTRQLIDEEVITHSIERSSGMRSAEDEIKPRNPEKVERRVEFWRRRRYERLEQVLNAVLNTGRMAEPGSTPQEQKKWEQMARLVRAKLSPEARASLRPVAEDLAPPRNNREWKSNVQSARRFAPSSPRREQSGRDEHSHRQDRPYRSIDRPGDDRRSHHNPDRR
jgi:hypothetical protein